MKKFILAFIAALSLLTGAAYAEEVYLACELETRPVMLNFQEDPRGRLPNLRYNGVPYLPLDEYNCAILGITVTDGPWTLSIDKRESGKYSVVPQISAQADMSAMVKTVDKLVIVNGRLHDNTVQDYPFVTFNGTVYMPVFWRYMGDME
ncbi:MAG: hypothetical protein ACI4SS_04865, partial [Clostridia bacterium]